MRLLIFVFLTIISFQASAQSCVCLKGTTTQPSPSLNMTYTQDCALNQLTVCVESSNISSMQAMSHKLIWDELSLDYNSTVSLHPNMSGANTVNDTDSTFNFVWFSGNPQNFNTGFTAYCIVFDIIGSINNIVVEEYAESDRPALPPNNDVIISSTEIYGDGEYIFTPANLSDMCSIVECVGTPFYATSSVDCANNTAQWCFNFCEMPPEMQYIGGTISFDDPSLTLTGVSNIGYSGVNVNTTSFNDKFTFNYLDALLNNTLTSNSTLFCVDFQVDAAITTAIDFPQISGFTANEYIDASSASIPYSLDIEEISCLTPSVTSRIDIDCANNKLFFTFSGGANMSDCTVYSHVLSYDIALLSYVSTTSLTAANNPIIIQPGGQPNYVNVIYNNGIPFDFLNTEIYVMEFDILANGTYTIARVPESVRGGTGIPPDQIQVSGVTYDDTGTVLEYIWNPQTVTESCP